MDNFLERFNQTALELIGDIRTVYPSLNSQLDTFIANFPCTNQSYITYFLENVSPHADLIAVRNIELFDKTKVLQDIDLKFIFVESESEPNRFVIWKYIEALYLYSQSYIKLRSETNVEDDMKKYMETIGFNAENFNKILENLQEQSKQENTSENTSENPNPIPPEMEKMSETLFGGMIGNLAKEIAGEINPNDLNIDPNNPQALLQNLFSPEKGNLMNLVQSISGKLQTKLDNGQLDQQALFNEATNIMSNLQNMPGMGDVMKNMPGGVGGMPGIDPSMMANLMSGLMGGSAKKDNSKNLSLLPKNHPKRRRK
jgi:hypothetical protein